MNKTRVLHVRVVGFSAPERQMLNSIFLLSVAPARQIGYKLWNPETGVAPDMYLLDGDSESAVASWQATFASTSDRTLVVGSKNTDLGVASAARPLGLKVVGAMDRLAIALNNVAREPAGHELSAPAAGGTLPTAAQSSPAAPRPDQTITRAGTGMTSQQPSLSASMNAPVSAAASTMSTAAASTMSTAAASTMSGAASTLSSSTLSSNAQTMTASSAAAPVGVMPVSMTAAAPSATVLPNVTLQPNIPPPLERALEKSINEKPVAEKTVDRILSEKQPEKAASPVASLQASGVTPLSPSALSAAVAPSTQRASLRVVTPSPLAASLPAAAPAVAKLAEAPMNASMPAAAPLVSKLADAPMQAPPLAPVAPVATAAPVTPPVPVMPAGAPTARHEEHNFRVLAVDDSPLMRTFLQNKLAPYGIHPEFAASGEEALFKISKQHFDLIFLDVMLPGMDGYDVCKMIKKNKDNALMKVVMLTSKDKTFDKIRGTMAGCDGYLTKPVDELKLRAIIERHSVTKK
jgi:CheY-like chemotaxis protein